MVKNNLKHLILIEKANLQAELNKKVTLGETKTIIGEYCGVSYHQINQVYRGLAEPSLKVALKIAQYFNKPVEEIFAIK